MGTVPTELYQLQHLDESVTRAVTLRNRVFVAIFAVAVSACLASVAVVSASADVRAAAVPPTTQSGPLPVDPDHFVDPNVFKVGSTVALAPTPFGSAELGASGSRLRRAPLEGEQLYGSVGARWTSIQPPLGVSIVTAEQAMAAVRSTQLRPDLLNGDAVPEVALVLFSDDVAGPIGDEGLMRPAVQDRLAFVIRYAAVVPAAAFGAMQSPVRDLSGKRTDFFVVVDALKGSLIEAVEAPAGIA